jgi:hypothetical protein
MAQSPDAEILSGLVRKGEAAPQHPRAAPGAAAERVAPDLEDMPPPPLLRPVTGRQTGRAGQGSGGSLTRVPRQDEPKSWAGFRIPAELNEKLEEIVYRTRRKKQDLLTEFVEAGIERLERQLDRQGN